MCGIFCSIVYNQNTFLNEIIKNGDFTHTNSQFAEFCDALKNRGPDYYEELLLDISPHTIVQFAGSVLWTQGQSLMPQPISDEGSILLWNGDIFFGPLACNENDAKTLSSTLKNASESGKTILQIISSIVGPYSFIYYDKNTKKIFFGRDPIGRHSLLIRFTQRNITITSVASRNLEGYVEVPAVGIFTIDLEKEGETSLTIYPWSHLECNFDDLLFSLPKPFLENLQKEETIQSYLQPPRRNSKIPSHTDLNMWRVQDQEQSLSSLLQKITLSDAKTRIRQTMEFLMRKPSVEILVEDLLKTLKQAVRIRVEKQPKLCKNCVKLFSGLGKFSHTACSHSKVAILFSGGLDSAVLAGLVEGFIPPGESIDLLNVAFEKPKKLTEFKTRLSKKESNPELSFDVPDRLSGLSTLGELKSMYPERKWNFVEINVTQEELKKERDNVIHHLIYPLKSVLDDSLGCALWFASRGKGHLNSPNELYISPARIMISGMGADEQLGGYMRHRTTLKYRGGWEALDKELQGEIRRLFLRNLGRDDRVASDHGRQLRMPYLDEDVINYLSFLPPWNRCYPVDSMPPGVGDKLLLRLTAWKLGFRNAANFPKRAMQFGSRIANSTEKGDDVSVRLKVNNE